MRTLVFLDEMGRCTYQCLVSSVIACLLLLLRGGGGVGGTPPLDHVVGVRGELVRTIACLCVRA